MTLFVLVDILLRLFKKENAPRNAGNRYAFALGTPHGYVAQAVLVCERIGKNPEPGKQQSNISLTTRSRNHPPFSGDSYSTGLYSDALGLEEKKNECAQQEGKREREESEEEEKEEEEEEKPQNEKKGEEQSPEKDRGEYGMRPSLWGTVAHRPESEKPAHQALYFLIRSGRIPKIMSMQTSCTRGFSCPCV